MEPLMKQNLRQALKSGQKFLACNFYNLETLQAILQAAALKKKAIILQMTQSSIEYMGLLPAVQMARAMKEHFGVQAFLHLDHAQSLDLIQRCLDAGFDSVMIDASEKPFDQNVALSQQVVQKARAYGACVEAELGYVAKLGQSTQKKGFTDPEQARVFVEQTGIDLLAVAIGSAHGFYKEPPNLDIERLQAIHQATSVALVLHGSSGISAAQLRQAIQNGIQKINLATEIKNRFMQTLKEKLRHSNEIDLRKVFPAARQAVTDLIVHKFEELQI